MERNFCVIMTLKRKGVEFMANFFSYELRILIFRIENAKEKQKGKLNRLTNFELNRLNFVKVKISVSESIRIEGQILPFFFFLSFSLSFSRNRETRSATEKRKNTFGKMIQSNATFFPHFSSLCGFTVATKMIVAFCQCILAGRVKDRRAKKGGEKKTEKKREWKRIFSKDMGCSLRESYARKILRGEKKELKFYEPLMRARRTRTRAVKSFLQLCEMKVSFCWLSWGGEGWKRDEDSKSSTLPDTRQDVPQSNWWIVNGALLPYIYIHTYIKTCNWDWTIFWNYTLKRSGNKNKEYWLFDLRRNCFTKEK